MVCVTGSVHGELARRVIIDIVIVVTRAFRVVCVIVCLSPSCPSEERVLRRTVGQFRASRRVLISCLRGDLPPSCSSSFFMDTTGGYPGGVRYSHHLYVTARPATKAPVTALYLRGRRCTAAPNEPERTNNACTATSVARGKAFTCRSGTLRKVMWRC